MFSDKLKELRNAKKMTQSTFAKEFHVATSTVAMWETGKREPDFDVTSRLANYFNVSVDYLLGVDEKEQKNTHLSETERRVQKFYEEHPIMYDLVDAISRLDKEQQKALLEYAEFQAQKYKQKD